MRFTGHIEDETGLVYMQARYYDPIIGRFHSPDPIGYQDQLNVYAYVGNDPVNMVDPNGMIRYSVGGNIEAVVFAGGRVGLSTSFDTETFELSGTISGGPRLGASIGAGVSFSASESGVNTASNSTSDTAKVTIEGNLGPLGYSKDIVSENSDGTVNNIGNGGSAGSVNKGVVKPKLQMKASVTAGIEFSGTASTSVVADAVGKIREVADRAVNKVFSGSNGEESGACATGVAGPCQ